MYDASMRKQTRLNIQGTLLQIKDNVTYKMNDIVQTSATLYDNRTLVLSLRSFEEGVEGYNRMNQVIIPKLESASKAIGLNLRMSVYFHNESVNERYKVWRDDSTRDFNEQTADIYHMSRIVDAAWYRGISAEQYNETMLWKQVEEDERDCRISLIRRIVDMNNPLAIAEVGIMRFSVRKSELFDSVNFKKLGAGSELIVMDDAGRLSLLQASCCIKAERRASSGRTDTPPLAVIRIRNTSSSRSVFRSWTGKSLRVCR